MAEREIPVSPTEVGSIWEPAVRDRAATLAAKGLPIGVFNRGVGAIWGDGGNPAFYDAVASIKGEKRGARPLAATMPTRDFVALLDPNQIPEHLHGIFLNAEELAARTDSLCFIRGTITQEAAHTLPSSIVSWSGETPVVQNWDARGHKPTYLLLKKMSEKGIVYPAVTSMNMSGTPEIVEQEEGIAFSRAQGIPFFLTDPRDNKRAIGSYTIIGVSQAGVELVRDGNVPGHVFPALLGTPIDDSHAAKAKYPQSEIPEGLTDNLNPREARIAILSSLHGYPSEAIRSTLAKHRE